MTSFLIHFNKKREKMFPKIKKKITSFLTSEEGKLSKESLIATGTFLAASAVGALLSAKDAAADCGPAGTHTNCLSTGLSGSTITATHGHWLDYSADTGSSCSGGSCSDQITAEAEAAAAAGAEA